MDLNKIKEIIEMPLISEAEKKWFWMMEYCKRKQMPPAQKWAWDEAEKKYNE